MLVIMAFPYCDDGYAEGQGNQMEMEMVMGADMMMLLTHCTGAICSLCFVLH